MNTLETYSKLIEKEISSFSFPSSPLNLYDPLRYFMTLGGKKNETDVNADVREII